MTPQNPDRLSSDPAPDDLKKSINIMGVDDKQQLSVQCHLQQLLTTSPLVIFTFRPSGTYSITAISENIKNLMGYEPERFTRDPDFWMNHIHPEDKPLILSGLSQAFSGRSNADTHTHEYRFRHQNGGYRWVFSEFRVLSDEKKQPVEAIGYWIDITERNQAEEKLRESEEIYRNLVDNIAIGVALVSPDMKILNLNKQMRQWFPAIDVSERPICYQAYNDPPRDVPCSYCPTMQTLRDGKTHEAVSETPAGDAIVRYRIISSPIKDDGGKIVAAIEMVEDITERLKTEQYIRELSRQLLHAQENERQRISRELHDSVAQDLSAVKIGLEIFNHQNMNMAPENREKLSALSNTLDRTIATIRNLSYDLRPPGLKEFGLAHAMKSYCEEFAKAAGIRVAFQLAGVKKNLLDPFLEINIYRLVQEGLNNVRKHAEADQVIVKLIGANPDIILRIEDNGKGFDVKERESCAEVEKRMGLRGMKERVRLLQGRMHIDSAPKNGTKLFIKLPVNGPKK